MTKRSLGIGLFLLLVAIGALLTYSQSPSPDTSHAKDSRQSPATDPISIDRQEVPSTTVRSLHIRASGKGAEQIYAVWSQRDSEVGLLATVTDQTLNEVRKADGLHRHKFETNATVSIPADKWVWIRLRAKSIHSPSRYFRVKPSPDDKNIAVDFAEETCAVHVKLYEQGLEQEFEMQPATHLTIEWLGSRPSEGCTVIIQTSRKEIGRMLRPMLIPRNGGHMIPALVCSAVVPRGDITLTALDPDGNELWTKTAKAQEARQFIEMNSE